MREPDAVVLTGPGTVLLVDDDAEVLEATAAALGAKGLEVLKVDNAVHALRLLASATVDVLVTDWAMPEMNGAELAARSRALRPDLPIVMMTGYPLGGRPGAESGHVATPPSVSRVMQKPVAPDVLANEILGLLAERDRRIVAQLGD